MSIKKFTFCFCTVHKASFNPFLTSMKAGESDTTQSSSVVMPIFVKNCFVDST